MEIEQRIYNGNRAKEVLENEAFIDAMVQIKTEIIEQWTQSPARDVEGRQSLWLMLKTAEKLRTVLQTTLETGKLANLDLEHKQGMIQRARQLVGMQ